MFDSPKMGLCIPKKIQLAKYMVYVTTFYKLRDQYKIHKLEFFRLYACFDNTIAVLHNFFLSIFTSHTCSSVKGQRVDREKERERVANIINYINDIATQEWYKVLQSS